MLLLGEVDGAADRMLKTIALVMGKVLVVDEVQAAARGLLRILICLAARASSWLCSVLRGNFLGHFLFKPIKVKISVRIWVDGGAGGRFVSLDHLHLCFAGLLVLTASTTTTIGHLLEGIVLGLGRCVGAMGVASLEVEGRREAVF